MASFLLLKSVCIDHDDVVVGVVVGVVVVAAGVVVVIFDVST